MALHGYRVNYVVWHFPRISLQLRVRESDLRYGYRERAPLTWSLPLPVRTDCRAVYESENHFRKNAKQLSFVNAVMRMLWI